MKWGMKWPGIRGQLTAWYSLILALSLAAFCCVTYFAMLYSIRVTAQSELSERTEGVEQVLQTHAPRGRMAMVHELGEFVVGLGPTDRVRVTDASGVIYASAGMEQPMQPRRVSSRPRPWRVWINGEPFLASRQTINIAGTPYDVTMAVATGALDRALTRGSVLIFATAPLFLVIAALGGFWMSQRALRPVDQMTLAARKIGAHDLSLRLDVPATRDELGRLGETLNAMLTRLEDAFRKITQFTADASHELRTPIAVMRTAAELALRKTRTEAEYQETLAQIVRETAKVSDLLENLLTLARSDAETSQLAMQRADLNEILDEACSASRYLAEQKNVTLSRNGTSVPTWVMANAPSVERLFLIVLDNAVKYTPSGGTVHVKLAAADGVAEAEVRDSGIGIAADDMPHIFDRFYRADRARTREPGGAGLGLAIGQWIAQAHGGEIRVESELAKGSSFKVRLPISN
jgi:heavy metal sensor kinase